MNRKGVFKLAKKIKMLQKKSDKLHHKLFLHINRDITLGDTDKLFIELGELNGQIGIFKKRINNNKNVFIKMSTAHLYKYILNLTFYIPKKFYLYFFKF